MKPDALEDAHGPVDYRPFVIADADTGHGGDAHVRNLIRRFVEAGVTGYHIEDQRPGTKKCGHQGGKVLVGVDEQIKRLNAARFQLDIMGVPGIIVSRTDAEGATLLDSSGDERDHPFILGATTARVPSYKLTTLAMMRVFFDAGVETLSGFKLYDITDAEYAAADAWLARTGLKRQAEEVAASLEGAAEPLIEEAYDTAIGAMVERWEADAGLMTIGEAVLAALRVQEEDGNDAPPISAEEWSGHRNHVRRAARRLRAHARRLRRRSLLLELPLLARRRRQIGVAALGRRGALAAGRAVINHDHDRADCAGSKPSARADTPRSSPRLRRRDRHRRLVGHDLDHRLVFLTTSPGLTSHATISPSVTPSPMSGSLNSQRHLGLLSTSPSRRSPAGCGARAAGTPSRACTGTACRSR